MPPTKEDAFSRKQYWIALATPIVIALPPLLVLCLIWGEGYLAFIYYFAWAALACCAPAAALSYTTLRMIQRMGKEAMKSREALLSGFEQVERILPRNTMISAVLLLLGGGSAVITIAPFIGGRGFFYCVGVVIILVPMGLWSLFRHVYPMLRRPLPDGAGRVTGRAITREQAPKVWELVEQVSTRARVVMPDNIIIGLDASFYATESALYLSGATQPVTGRSLFLSVPYMAFMSRDELAVVIGHELAHFTGADTEYTLKFARIYARAHQHYEAMDLDENENDSRKGPPWLTAPARALVAYFLSNFDLAVQHWSRDREFLADAVGAAAAPSPAAAAIALMRTTTLAHVIEPVLHTFAYNGGRSSHPGGLLASVLEAVAQAPELDPLKHLEESQPHPRESHPPTQQRIEALGVALNADLVLSASSREPSGLLEELGLR
ncbi:hypothetical protein AXK12_07580 [Cephaloticoccus capnophilus]|uniref:Peptidase M48 domain-containing protein n=1 Tax=Cephaloticoccus capnophilus TaxID=1548208 RepID=A0A139SIE9_9BACT|nr:M48 family metallopeptidase [Cephaloticoccus capnophilus]KXU34327.1 hypothetical protein AXK12_07580 [Cephaloticoccus capnophilus]